MTLALYSHTGNFATTGLASGISNSDVSFTVLSGTNYPVGGAAGDFVMCIDPGTASEEKVLCSGRASNVFTVAGGGRGYDGTTATSHAAGSTNVTHCISAAEANDLSAHVYTTTRNDHTQYAELAGATFTGLVTAGDGLDVTGTTALTGNLTVSGTINGGATDAAWTAVSGGVGFANGWGQAIGGYLTVGYRKVNGRVYLRGVVDGGTTGMSTPAFTLPAGYRPAATGAWSCYNSSNASFSGCVQVNNAGAVLILLGDDTGLDNVSFDTLS